MRRPAFVLSVVSVLTAVPARAGGPDLDQERSAWRFRRVVTVPWVAPGQAPAFAALPLPPEVASRCQPELQDPRLVDAEGRDVAYVVDRVVERETGSVWSGRLVDVRPEKRVRSVWVVDLGESRSFDEVTLDIRQQGFAKRIQLDVSEDGASWRTVREDAGVFDRPWNVRVHHTSIAFADRLSARYLRLTADDGRSKPVEVQGVAVSASRRVPGEVWRRPVVLQPLRSDAGVSRYRLDLPSGYPLEALELEAQDPAFSRRVVLHESRETGGRKQESILGDANLYRLRIEDEALSGESLLLPLRHGPGGERVLEIHDGDSPPLRQLRVVATAPATRLLFAAAAGPLTLYYGNDATRAPVYDIQTLQWRIGLAPSFAAASLGPEAENARYRKAAPLPFAAARGAAIDVARWASVRPLTITGGEDLYTLSLGGEDLGLLRPDLGDLRIVDGEGQQLPYILEPAASESRLVLQFEKQSGVRSEGRDVTRYRVSVAAPAAGRPRPLPLASLELSFLETFFSRPARVVAPPPAGRRGGDQVLFRGTLSGTTRRPAAAAEQGRGDREPIVLALDAAPREEMSLEVDDGDNVPLTLLEAVGVVRVPRIAFKAGPGSYRLLMGNPAAASPRYDIATLRQEILSYSALPVPAGASAANPSFRRRASDYFKDGSPTLVLWGTLLVAVAALLFLTARILRQPATPSS